MSIGKRIRAFYNPEVFQGWGRTSKYFEGWYYKVVSADLEHALAIIPGIAYDDTGEGHAFIQVMDGRQATAVYHSFPIEEFSAEVDHLSVAIGSNNFSESQIILDLPGLSGKLKMTGNVPWPKPWYAPGIMGPFAYAPFMECYHGIVSMDHQLSGSFLVKGTKVSFEDGRGYIEKDWGRSFPEAYIWMQCNHFSIPGCSIKASVAQIPWVTGAFTGFIAGIWLGDRLLRFTTYNGTALKSAKVGQRHVDLEMENRYHALKIRAKRPEVKTTLASPILGSMEGRIAESMTAELDVTLTDKRAGRIIFQDKGVSGGLEVAGRIELIAQLDHE